LTSSTASPAPQRPDEHHECAAYDRCVASPQDELTRALALEDETERKLTVVSLIHEQVERLGCRAVVIGGLGVEF
jgi:hypothetical protein